MVPAGARCKVLGLVVWCLLLVTTCFVSSPSFAGGGPRNVLVVVNSTSEDSTQIASYYLQARGIPTTNVCTLVCSTDEIVTKAECDANIIAPIRSFLQTSPIADRINYIVVTKGVPLGATGYFTSGAASVTSLLTCVARPDITAAFQNPYRAFTTQYAAYDPYVSIGTAFAHDLPQFGGSKYYLVTRLDGYSVDQVKALIDRSQYGRPTTGTFLLDGNGSTVTPDVYINAQMATANGKLQSIGFSTMYDNTSQFLGGVQELLGYFSWGSNDAQYSFSLYTGNTFLPGSIADTHVSTSGRTFAAPQATGQSLIADLIPCGVCGVSGYVSEPFGSRTRPDVLFDMYTKGFNVAESFYMATPYLFYKSVVVADPLMAPYAPPQPAVTIVPPAYSPPVLDSGVPQITLTGDSTLVAMASSAMGISKVEFYFDDVRIATVTQAPYSVTLHTTDYAVGAHTIEVIAYDAGPTATQGSTDQTVIIENLISNLKQTAEGFHSPDGQSVRANERIVTAATEDMGNEFYIEDPDRSAGIRVLSDVAVREGDIVTVVGPLCTDSGERGIIAGSVEITGAAAKRIEPLGMPNRMVGGSAFHPQTPGITGGTGLRNLGLLIRTWGRVTYVGGDGEDFFYIDDGSSLEDGSGHFGLKVRCRNLPKPQLGSQVTVTGISSCEALDGRVIPIVKLRKPGDLFTAAQ